MRADGGLAPGKKLLTDASTPCYGDTTLPPADSVGSERADSTPGIVEPENSYRTAGIGVV
jgi:hypothetical protein